MPTFLSTSSPLLNSPMTGQVRDRISTPMGSVGSPNALPPEQQEALTRRIFNTAYNEERGTGFLEKTVKYAATSVIDLGDSILSNNLVPGNPIDRGDVWNFVGDYGGEVGVDLEQYYQRNQAMVETISGIGGAIATGYMAGALLLPRISSALASSTMISGSRLWQAGARANAATRSRMLMAQEQAARNGEMFAMWANPAGRSYLANRAGKMVGVAAFEEAAITATLNSNRAVWSDDMSTNLMFAGLGMGVGAALGTVSARAEMRRLANSPELVKMRADAIDPHAYEGLREHQPEEDILKALAAGSESMESANLTSLLLSARQQTPGNATSEMASRMETLRVSYEKQAVDSAQKIASKGVQGISRSQFRLEGSIGKHIQDTWHDDPTAFFGLEEMGTLRGQTLEQAITTRQEAIQGLKDSQLGENIRKARRMEEQEGRILIGKRWYSAAHHESRAFSEYEPGKLEYRSAKGTHEFRFRLSSGKGARVNESFNVPNFSKLHLHDRLQVLEGMNHLFDTMKKAGDKYILPARPTWFQIDSALEFEKRGGKVDWKTHANYAGSDAARVTSLSLKAEEIGARSIGDSWERLAYNLPAPNSLEAVYDGSGDSLRAAFDVINQGGSEGEALKVLEELRASAGFELRGAKANLFGDMFNFNRDSAGEWRNPVLGFFQNEQFVKPLDEYGLAQQLAERKASRYNSLTKTMYDNRGNVVKGVVPDLVQQLHSLPDFMASMNIRGLSDEQVTGVGNFGTQLVGEALTREMRYRDNQTVLGALKVREAVNRTSDAYISALLKTHMGDVVDQLNSAVAYPSKVLLNQFASNTAGWDLAKDAVPMGDGKYGFALMKTYGNEARLGRPVAKDELLVNPRTGKHIVLDELGKKYMTRFNSMSDLILNDVNRLRSAMGLDELRKKQWYTPPIRTKGMHVGYTFDELNRPVPGGAVVAATRDEFNRLAAEKRKTLAKGFTFRTREQVGETADLWEAAGMDWIDPGVTVRPNRGQTGSLAPDTVNPNAVADMLTWTKEQVEAIGTNVMRTLYDSQLQIARARGATERAIRAQKSTGRIRESSDARLRTVWDEYENTILGKNPGDTARSISGSVMYPVESFIDGAIEQVWPALRHLAPSQVGDWVGSLWQAAGAPTPKKGAKSFDELAKALGPYTPYKDAVDYAEQTLNVIRPPKIQGISEKLNWFSAATVLRYFELPHAAMNIIGVITTMPSIVRSGRAPITTSIVGKDGTLGIVDSYKIMARATQDMFSPRRRADWDEMVKNGDASQQVAEFNKQLSLVKDQSSFDRVMFGTGDTKGAKGGKAIFNERGIDGLISVLTDKSENFSRGWSHMIGLRLADYQGITGMQARHDFAREIANAGIANYSPLNRPELFQSAFGSMFGLFMSWMQSYNQRLFRWMENGQYADVGRQMAMQASLFGVGSLPGYKQVESMLLAAGIGKTEDGEEALLSDHIYARFGPEIGSTLMHGSLAQLGLVLYTRGDMNYRDVSFDPSQVVASIGVMTNGVKFVKETIQSTLGGQAIAGNGALAEILARNMPNRAMKGILTVGLNEGQDIDARGNVVSETQSWLESALRLTGLRSGRQQAEIEAFYADRRLQDRETSRMEKLRTETRALLRTKGWENRLMEVFDKYVKSGGRPENFRTWIRDQVRNANSTRGMNDLAKALRSDSSLQKVWRYNAYGALAE